LRRRVQRSAQAALHASRDFLIAELLVRFIIHIGVHSMTKHTGNKSGQCVFCGRSGLLTKTHIWPDWLERLLRPPGTRLEEETRPIGSRRQVMTINRKYRLGSMFSQKPYLACAPCNTGWMQKVEDEMVKFSKPLFLSYDPFIFTQCGWLSSQCWRNT
jgi:hypothetical protein